MKTLILLMLKIIISAFVCLLAWLYFGFFVVVLFVYWLIYGIKQALTPKRRKVFVYKRQQVLFRNA